VIPPIVFLITNAFLDFNAAMWSSLGIAALLTGVRLIKHETVNYALGGLGIAALAIVLSKVSNSAQSYFLPDMITGGITTIIAMISVFLKRPLVAWTSHLARGWPLAWYWHPNVRPAYSEVTLVWALFFTARLSLQLFVFQTQRPTALSALNLITGWPATIILLTFSYLYGLWRLQSLKGPSIEEFKNGANPPWEGQRRGF